MTDRVFKVLLVEDNREYAWMLRLILTEMNSVGFEITHALTLAEGQSQLASEPFDVILLDLSLPDSRGFGTFTAVSGQAPHIPIVVMTALDDRELALRAVREGAQDYLVKGEMDVHQLVRAMEYAVERQQTVENLRRLSMLDELTGLLNRRGFLTLAEKQIKIARRASRDLTLFFGDVDDLKQINDRFGHSEGDRALKSIAKILRDTFRSSDLISRLGGDEFTVLAIDTSAETSETILKRLQEAIDLHNQNSQTYQLSISTGVARFNPKKSDQKLSDLLAQADQALYEQKQKMKVAHTDA
jgi:diguanylate cyclase (GGDEF)-like protein